MIIETGVTAHFSSAHRAPDGDKLHGHTWTVTVWWPFKPKPDAVARQEQLKGILAQYFNHRELPLGLSLGEDIAAYVLHLIPDADDVLVSRPIEGIHARARRWQDQQAR